MTVYVRTHALSNYAVPAEKIPNTLKVLLPKLEEVKHLWWQLGLQLKQHPAPLDDIRTRPNRKTVQEKFEQMLEYWLNEGEDEYRTWGALAEAVHNSGNRPLGFRIRSLKHFREHSKGIYIYSRRAFSRLGILFVFCTDIDNLYNWPTFRPKGLGRQRNESSPSD